MKLVLKLLLLLAVVGVQINLATGTRFRKSLEIFDKRWSWFLFMFYQICVLASRLLDVKPLFYSKIFIKWLMSAGVSV